MQFTYLKLAIEISGFVNMNKTERIMYAFNTVAPGGRYKQSVRFFKENLMLKSYRQHDYFKKQ